ncbi:MAG TPA: N-acetylmuramoyl-L-alanine amidase [Terriglobales bacterium]|jgi:N-acetylmuramoyl-L-alanine amidase|nr:N-acetylmuramoyl-L-alanine amidase [Terriglobales bacterium]
MSASPKTALDAGASVVTPTSTSLRVARPTTSSGEALQALLAFSALHQQIRHRRLQEKQDGTHASPDGWQLEHFVLDEVLQLVAERALAITGADGVAIALAEGDAIICRATAGEITPDAGVRLDPNSGFSGACLSSGQVIRCDDSETDSRVNTVSCRVLGTRSMVAVPLSAKQTNIGLLEAFSTEPYGFNDSDVRSLTLLAELILAALRPEEEDRLAEISQRVVARAPVAVSVLVPVEGDHAEQDPIRQGHTEEDRPEQSSIAQAESETTQPQEAHPEIQESDINTEVEDAKPAPAVATVSEYGTVTNSRPGLLVVVTLVVIALALGTGLWWKIHQHKASVASTPQKIAQARTNFTPTPQTQATITEPAAEPAESEQEENVQEAPATTSGERPEVTGLRHWSSADSSTVVIDLQDQVQYEAHRLSHPERIYLDLPDTRLVSSLLNKTIDVGDALLQRVRVAQPTHGVTRVVLETKGASNFSVSLEPNPYRLVIELRTIESGPKPRAKVELFGPMDQASQPPLLAENARNALPSSRPVLDPKLRIVLDAGHGGWDLGTVGRKGLLEKDLVLDIVERLGKLVENRLAASVIYTRTDDNYIALEKRAEIANLAKANLFLSIHANYSDFPSARGVETYYTNTYSSVRARSRESDDAGTTADVDWTNVDIREKVHQSRRLAASIQRALYGTLSTTNPGLPNRGVKQAQYVVLTGTSMPAVLAEVSFVSSPTDENNLQSSSYRQRIAEALYQGVARYAEESRVKIASAERPAGQ